VEAGRPEEKDNKKGVFGLVGRNLKPKTLNPVFSIIKIKKIG